MLKILNPGKHLMKCFRNLSSSALAEPIAVSSIKSSTHSEESEPLILPLDIKYQKRTCRESRPVWIENIDSLEEQKLGLIELHPEIFACQPRVDLIQENIEWQQKYRFVSFAHTKTRAEARGGGRKPWPQKGLGKARHGSIRSPLFRGGGIAHGPRSPTTHFYMLPFYKRIMGLTSCLSVKLAQDDLHIVRDLEIPTQDSNFIIDLCKERKWGPSVLIIDNNDIFPENICYATNNINYINLMPVYGLNTYSMLKYETLILTVTAVREIEDKILFHLNRTDANKKEVKFKLDQ